MMKERNPEQVFLEICESIKQLCKNYDDGFDYMSLSISNHLRTLFWDNKNGSVQSILSQCGLKDKIKLLDASAPRNCISFLKIGDGVCNLNFSFDDVYCGLDCKDVYLDSKGVVKYNFSPLCSSDVYSGYEKRCKDNNRFLSMEEWMGGIIYEVRSQGYNAKLSRRELILTVCNKDGGTHYDPCLTYGKGDVTKDENGTILKGVASYEMFCNLEDNVFFVNSRQVSFENNPMYPAIRQIAREVLVSLEEYM